ncbi:MAG: hydroxymethylbilane synthase [Bryobacteraceae bacterium]
MIVIGSRGSQLALWQANWVKAQLEASGESARIEIIKTSGDRITDVPLAEAGGKGLFTKEIEDALLARHIDLAVHSLKDLPTALPEGLCLAAVPQREDARDALVGRTLAGLRHGAKVGTSSLRRVAQLRAARPDLEVESIRGNVDTRLRKLAEGQFEAIVLAAAGLRRLGFEDRIAEPIPMDIMCPAVGQGALGIETRDDGGAAASIRARLDHAATRIAVEAERSLLAALGGGCQVPIGAYAEAAGDELRLRAVVASPDGSRIIRREVTGAAADARKIGEAIGAELLASGGREILEMVYGGPVRARD